MSKDNGVYYRIYCTLTKKYLRWKEDNRFLVFEYPAQAWNFIHKECKDSVVYKVISWQKKVRKNGR